MTIWDRLGIERTTDIKAIRSAYAARAKECHPEERPAEFKELQSAYKGAVQYAKGVKEDGEEMPWRNSEVSEEGNPKNLEAGDPERLEEESSKSPGEEEPEVLERENSKGLEEEDPRSPGEEESEGEKARETLEYDFSGVRDEELETRFFQELCYLAMNPYLINNLLCWELLVKRPEYRNLFCDASFRKNVVLTMCYRLSGWKRATIRYFDAWLKEFQDQEEEPETEISWWRRMRDARMEKPAVFRPEGAPSAEQTKLHALFLSELKRELDSDDLNDPVVLSRYCTLYLSYALKNPRRVEFMYESRKQLKPMLIGFLLATVSFAALVIYLEIWKMKN